MPDGDHVERAAGERVHALHRAGGVDLAAACVELAEQILAVVHAVGVDAVGEPQVLDARPARGERPVRDAEVAGFGAACSSPRRLTNGGTSFALAAAELRHHRAEARVVRGAVDAFSV